MTVPLVTSADGKKFGKSTGGGSLWLDPEMTSPYAWYQYFVNTADADVVRYLRWFTFLTATNSPNWRRRPRERPHAREAQRRLAAEMTTLVHGEAEHPRRASWRARRCSGARNLAELDESTLAAALREAAVDGKVAGACPQARSSICSWQPACARARVRPGERSRKAARR